MLCGMGVPPDVVLELILQVLGRIVQHKLSKGSEGSISAEVAADLIVEGHHSNAS